MRASHIKRENQYGRTSHYYRTAPLVMNESVALREPVHRNESCFQREPLVQNESAAVREPVHRNESTNRRESCEPNESNLLREPESPNESRAYERTTVPERVKDRKQNHHPRTSYAAAVCHYERTSHIHRENQRYGTSQNTGREPLY